MPRRAQPYSWRQPKPQTLIPVPRRAQVYSWFLGTHKVSVAAGLAGYGLLVVEMTGIGALLRPVLSPTGALILLWYGLYFGILGRDAAEVAADRMVRPKLYTSEAARPNMANLSPRRLVLWGPGPWRSGGGGGRHGAFGALNPHGAFGPLNSISARPSLGVWYICIMGGDAAEVAADSMVRRKP